MNMMEKLAYTEPNEQAQLAQLCNGGVIDEIPDWH